MSSIPNVRKRRGTVLSSITRLVARLEKLESQKDLPTTFDLAQSMVKKLETLDAEFRMHHYQLVDLIDESDVDTLLKEQEVLDGHDDKVAELTIRIQQLVTITSSSADSSQRKAVTRRISRSLKSVSSIHDDTKALTGVPDICLLKQYEE